MLLHFQSTIWKPPLHPQTHPSFSSASSDSLSFSSWFSNSHLFQARISSSQTGSFPLVKCSISQVHSYGTMDYERRPMVKWNSVYKRISLMENPDMGSASVLNQVENERKQLTKWELCRIVRELRKFRRYKRALEVYEWMNNRGESFTMTTSDTAIQLDLIAKVHGIPSAENYFLILEDGLKDKRVYGALLNSYVRTKMKEKAESLMDQMRNRGYASHALPFNVMMTLYMNFKDYDEIDVLVSEMMEKGIPLDIYSYNIWLSACGSQGSAERMEHVFEQMKLDVNIHPTWATFSTMATMYIKLCLFEKAEDCLKMLESIITGRDRTPYHFLISLYGSVSNKEEVRRVWNKYKSLFPTVTNMGYHAMISSLVRVGDIESAEKTYEDWLSVKSTYDPRVGNLLLSWYVRKESFDKAKAFFDQMVDGGGKPNSNTWEILAEGHIKERRISEALHCLKEALLNEGLKSWRPKPANVSSFLKLCEQEANTEGKEVLLQLLRKTGLIKDEAYMSYIPISSEIATGSELPRKEGVSDEEYNDNSGEDDGAAVFLSQLQGSL